LVNLGTPEGTGYWPMRRYLKEFLSDRRVIEAPRAIWWPVLNGIILTVRPSKSGAKYAKIWNKDQDESPLKTITRAQAELVAERFAGDGRIFVDWAMRYGAPSISGRIEALMAAGCDRVLVFPLYPQYSATTTATVNDMAFDVLKRQRRQPALRTVAPFPDDPAYIGAVADGIRRHFAAIDFQPDILVLSFHGLPKEYFDKGDPYYCHCQKTGRLITAALGWPLDRVKVTFQSRFGPKEWLQPYTDETLVALAGSGVAKVAVATPGFVADCLETLEEIGMENRDAFLAAGGTHYSAVPCINTSNAAIDMLAAIIRRELSGWI
ncbi:MAG: ferrochelatase, partial [Hyphomicrobiales bacterium]|nr:ferrochelatase [Hyphomicrobiales bacterium]